MFPLATSRIRTALRLLLQDASRLPSEENAIRSMDPTTSWNACRIWPVAASRSLISPPKFPEATSVPSGETATVRTPRSSRICHLVFPVAKSHTRTCPPSARHEPYPVTTQLSSGESAEHHARLVGTTIDSPGERNSVGSPLASVAGGTTLAEV